MSFNAFVAYERSAGEFDLYHSHNGAENYMLKPVLEGYLDGEVPEDAGGMPAVMPGEVAQVAAEADAVEGVELEVDDHDLIDSEPMATDVPAAEIGNHVNFYGHEIAYVVRDWEVEVYVPVLASPLVLNTLQSRVEVAIYERDEVGGLSRVNELMEADPKWVLSGDDFLGEGIDQLDDEPRRLLEDIHVYLLDNYQKVLNDSSGADRGVISFDEYMIEVRQVAREPLPANVGLFIRVPWVDGEPKYPWHEGGAGDQHPATVASRHRLDLAREFIDEGYALEEEMDVEGLGELLARNQLKFAIMLCREFGDDVSEEFIPEKYADFVRRAKDAVGV